MARRLIVGITGASGVVYGIRLLEILKDTDGIETHLIITEAGCKVIGLETDRTPDEIERLADHSYDDRDITAPPASGTFRTMGMIVIPCSIKSLSALARSHASGLLHRAGDATLKERRPLLVAVRESPFHLGHLKLMAEITEMGGIVVPPIPAFYHRPSSVAQIVDHTIGKILDLMHIEHALCTGWEGMNSAIADE